MKIKLEFKGVNSRDTESVCFDPIVWFTDVIDRTVTKEDDVLIVDMDLENLLCLLADLDYKWIIRKVRLATDQEEKDDIKYRLQIAEERR